MAARQLNDSMFRNGSGTLSTERSAEHKDDLDELFNYDAGLNDPFSNNYEPDSTQQGREDAKNTSSTRGNEDLGIDDEIDLTRKQRAPRAFQSYDQKQKFLNLKERVMRFLDALAMVEKLGHKKQILAMRMDWINDRNSSVPLGQEQEEEEISNAPQSMQNMDLKYTENNLPIQREIGAEGQAIQHASKVDEIDDLIEDTAKPVSSKGSEPLDKATSTIKQTISHESGSPNHEVPEDELDALLADKSDPFTSKHEEKLCFDDDEDAMAEMEMEW